MKPMIDWFICLFLLLSITHIAQAECKPGALDRQKEQRAGSLEALKKINYTELNPSEDSSQDDQLGKVWMIFYSFKGISFKASTYRCKKSRMVDYREHRGISWIVDVSDYKRVGILDVRGALSDYARRNPERYQVRHNFFVDVESGSEIPISSTIDFVKANLVHFFPDSDTQPPRAIVSGPYWKTSEYGEEVIGLFKKVGDGSDLSQGYHVNFRARHILCTMDTGLDLISPPIAEPPYEGDALKREMERQTEKCSSAIQIGPAYFERNEQMNKTGIAGLSLSEAARNILIRAVGNDKSEKTFLWTIKSRISPFDAMVLIEAIADELVGEKSIAWAVGLTDDDFLSGPTILLDDGSEYDLAPTDSSVGALLVFYGS